MISLSHLSRESNHTQMQLWVDAGIHFCNSSKTRFCRLHKIDKLWARMATRVLWRETKFLGIHSSVSLPVVDFQTFKGRFRWRVWVLNNNTPNWQHMIKAWEIVAMEIRLQCASCSKSRRGRVRTTTPWSHLVILAVRSIFTHQIHLVGCMRLSLFRVARAIRLTTWVQEQSMGTYSKDKGPSVAA